MLNHQLQKFPPLRLVSYVAVIIYLGPREQREQRWVNASGAFLVN